MTAAGIALAAIGAALGGMARYALWRWATVMACRPVLGTFLANVAASGVAGWAFAMWSSDPGSVWGVAVGAGFAGALSTWSTLAGEIVDFAREKSWWAIGYPLATVAAGATATGLFL